MPLTRLSFHYPFIYKSLLETLILSVIVCAFWYASPIRDQWVWLIALVIPFFVIWWIRQRRLWSGTPIDEFLAGLIGLCVINLFTAPYETRGVILIYRPLMGLILYAYLSEHARSDHHIRGPLRVTVFGALLLGIVALTATDWSEGKQFFSFITNYLPVVKTYPGEAYFNANEIAGAMVWIAPLSLGLFFYYKKYNNNLMSWIAGISAVFLFIALVLGQSLSALAGITIGMIIVLTPRRYWMAVTAAIVLVIAVIQMMILFNPALTVQIATRVSGRENINSLEHRQAMWIAARQSVIDHPITGIGMAMFRSPVVWEDYPTPGFDRSKAVHAHNELLQIATDLGIPGLMLMVSWYAGAGYMLYYAWKRTDDASRWLIMGIAGGLIAHIVYGLGDAIPLWDRFAFLMWWVLGLAATQYTLARFPQSGLDLDKNSTSPSTA